MMNILRLLKAFLVGVTGLFIVITLFSLLIPSTVQVSRATVISNVTMARVNEQVGSLGNWKNWHPLFKSDSAAITFNASKTACDIVYNGNHSRLTIKSTDSSVVQFDLMAKGENNIHNQIILTQLPGQQSIQVEWQALNKLRWYPWEKFYGIFIDKLTGPGYDAALAGLKSYLETK